jgi:hypothetical protein
MPMSVITSQTKNWPFSKTRRNTRVIEQPAEDS